MSRIVISDDKSLENLDIKFDHLLANQNELSVEKGKFASLEKLMDNIPQDFFPAVLISGSKEKALSCLEGKDELELLFMIMLAGDGREDELLSKLRDLKPQMEKLRYRDFLNFLFLHAKDNRQPIIDEIKELDGQKDGITSLLISAYSDELQEVSPGNAFESICAGLFEAVKAEKQGEIKKAFGLMLQIFEKSGYHSFIYEVLKFYIVQYNDIDIDQITAFTNKVTQSPLTVSFSSLKFVEFLYYFRNKVTDKLESSVSALAESTDSLFILNVIAPLLYSFEKWHLIGKYYKLSAKKTTGPERTKYLELLADIYENKLDMPDFATEIHKNIVEDDPMSCSVSLSRVLSVYEENGMWKDLYNLYQHLSDREEDNSLKAYYLYKAGDVLHRELKRSADARDLLEKSLALKHSFEVVRTLSEIYLKMHYYDAYLSTLLKELEFCEEPSERIRILNIIAETFMTHKKDYISAEKYLLNILEINENHLSTIKKLGKIYYQTRSWKKLTDINFREIDLTKDLTDIVNLYYRTGSIFFRELGDMARSKECFMEILEIKIDHIPSLLYLEKIYLRERDISNLIILYRQLLEASHTDSETRQYYLTRLGIIYRDNDMEKEALEIFRKIIEMFPENIMAKENLRMIEGKPDFSLNNKGNFVERDLQLFADLIKSGDASFIADQYLMRNENSLWKYLYFFRKDGKKFEPVSEKLGSEEQFAVSLLSGKYFINDLVKNSSRKTALMLLVEKYLEEGHYKGIATVLKYYLKFEPSDKRSIWTLFFKGRDNPELKEEFEDMLLNGADFNYMDIVRDILEKIYEKEKDYSTILFLRITFAKKIADEKSRCDFIDKTVKEFSDYIDVENFIDLYRLRYKSTSKEEKASYLEKYSSYLKLIERESLLIPVYEEMWKESGEIDKGTRFLDLLFEQGDTQRAFDVSKELLNKEWNYALFIRMIRILEADDDLDPAISEVKKNLETQKEEETVEKLCSILFDMYLKAGYSQNAVELFHSRDFSDPNKRFSEGLKVAEILKQNGYENDSVKLVKKLIPQNEDQAILKLKFQNECGVEITEADFLGIESYSALAKAFNGDMPEKIKFSAAEQFAGKGDKEAMEIHIAMLLQNGKTDEVEGMISKFPKDSFAKKIFRSRVLKREEKFDEEAELLKEMLFESILKGEVYTVERLAELKKGNIRLKCFLDSVLEKMGKESNFDEKLFSRIFSLKKEVILKRAGFSQREKDILEYASIIAIGKRDDVRNPGRPFAGNSQRNLLRMIEEIRLSIGDEGVDGVWNDTQEEPFKVVQSKMTVIVFGPKSLEIMPLELRYKIIQKIFLHNNGVINTENEEAMTQSAENIYNTFEFSGREKVKFIKSVRSNLQGRLLELFNSLENVKLAEIEDYMKKTYAASVFQAFSLIPDIRIQLEKYDCSLDKLEDESSQLTWLPDFVNKSF